MCCVDRLKSQPKAVPEPTPESALFTAIVGIDEANRYPLRQLLLSGRQSLSLFNELKRRNVFKVAAAYIIVAWLLLQVSDTLVPALRLPEWFQSGVAFLLILGLPVALLFAWAWEMTPEGLKKEKKAGDSKSDSKTADDRAGEIETADPQITEKSVAVLPFVNMSDDSGNEFFSDGISEELLNLLARIPELRVAARTSSFSLKGKELQISEVGNILKVAHVLEGSVRKTGNQVRITVQLIKVSDGYHLWSETYNHTLDNIFAIQDSIATKVVEQLKLTLLGEKPEVYETDPEAYTLYLQARQLARQGTSQAFEQSVTMFQEALIIDPHYAAAWAGLASVYNELTNKGRRHFDKGYALAREAAEKALVINPDYADAHASLGWIAEYYDRDLAMAARHFEHALALEPTNPDILCRASTLVGALGRIDECTQMLEYAVSCDPINSHNYVRLGIEYLYARRLDDAIDSLRTAVKLSPGRIAAHHTIGIAELLKGNPEAALVAMHLESNFETGWHWNGKALVNHALGQAATSDAALQELIEGFEQVAAYNIAYILAFRGETDRAFEWLDKAMKYKDPGLSDVAVHPLFANIHDDPRWLPFLESIGYSPEQLAAIEFKVTLPHHHQK